MVTTFVRDGDERILSSSDIAGRLSLILVLALAGGVSLGLLEAWYRRIYRLEFVFEVIAPPCFLAAAWMMLALWRRGRRRVIGGGVLAGALALLPPAFVVFAPRPAVGWVTLAEVIGYQALALLAGCGFAWLRGRLTWTAVAVALGCWVVVFALTALSGYAFMFLGALTMPILLVMPFVASTHPADDEYTGWSADERLRWGYLLILVGLVAGWVGTVSVVT